MPRELDYDPNIQRYQRMPRYQLDEDRGSGWQIWALVILIAGGALFFALISGSATAPVDQTGGATEPAISAPAAEDGAAETVPQSVMETDGQ